ncbi:hypothetical protein SANTM175S_08916 [Streptomyces antimycoticus]
MTTSAVRFEPRQTSARSSALPSRSCTSRPSSLASSRLARARRLERLLFTFALAMTESTSTPASSSRTPGLTLVPVALISTKWVDHSSTFALIIPTSAPGMGERTEPWLSAPSRRMVRSRRAGTPGASADSSRVHISRLSPTKPRQRSRSCGSVIVSRRCW